MAKQTTEKPQTDTVETSAQPVIPATPSSGGSYLVDDATGEHTLTGRTEPNTKTRSKP
jgi:hypothetical protein